MRNDTVLHTSAGLKPARAKRKYGTSIVGILFVIPAAAFISFAIFIPTVWNLVLSFQEWDGYLNRKWVGFHNYTQLLQDSDYRSSLYNSVFLAVISTVCAVLIGVVLAGLLYKLGKREGAVYRLVLFLPSMLPLAIIALLFSFIYNPEMGLLNQFLRAVGGDSLANAWLEDKHTVMYAIIVVGVWRIAGLTMMLCFAAIQGIPSSLFESSRLEGANYFKQFLHIVWPLIRPIVRLATIFTLVIQFKTYDLVFVLTGGGPGKTTQTVPLSMIDTAFGYSEFGLSAAMGFILALVVLALIYVSTKLLRGDHYEF